MKKAANMMVHCFFRLCEVLSNVGVFYNIHATTAHLADS